MTGQLHLTCEAGQRYFLTTSAAAECRSGQQLRVFGSGSDFRSSPAAYQTEELAASTLELIWCLDEPLTHQGDETTRSHRP